MSDENLRGNQYRDIERSIAHLGKATIRIEGKKSRSFRQYGIFSMCGYEDGCIIARFDPDLKPHFLNLKAQFTAYNLFEYLTLPSSYSQRIFEILKSWANSQEVIISVAELNEALNTPPSFRKDFKAFRVRVLEKAYKDILEHTSLRFEWEPIKVGRSVEKIRFIFGTRRALAEKIKADAKEEKRQRIASQRLLRAVECAKNRGGDCRIADNVRVVCRICAEFKCCESVQLQLKPSGV